MKTKWILLLVLLIIIGGIVILPCIAPSVTPKNIVRGAEMTTGDAFMIANQSEIALGCYEQALRLCPDDNEILKKKADALVRSGKTLEAGTIYAQVLAGNANDTAALVRAGDLLYRGGNYTDAISYYHTAITIQPDNARTWIKEGDAYLMLSIQEEQRLHEVAKNLGKTSGTSSAVSIGSMDSYKTAVADYQKAMALDPKLTMEISAKLMGITQYQVNDYASLLNDLQSSH